ncbi:TonB-dependent siderophore receptor [Bacteroides sp. ET336]|uniref:TonB-dependent receptor plug domain-containing protein n=1 Tax=Bacteroides sp. ET336 TaxID=2972459 RepID=UPI0021AC8939|nr:TonB-dependent receptor [Bacteroides sp. ET336]MCR8895072.1 TonB-dependent receptor [Bacteroides sp. ET336]MDN0059568.1 TonB-dependent receptor [Bacteroides caecigallinarum]
MKENIRKSSRTMRFKHYSRRSYAVFSTLKSHVTIGVMTVAMLASVPVSGISAQTVKDNNSGEKLYELEEVEVTGSRVPLTVSQAARIVTVLDREAIAAAPVQSINDLLKYAAGVDVRQRGDMGVQTDISIRGGTFDQITILLNGINICDPQTGHNAADFPVELSEIERIEVLEGPAGRVYGTSSLVGAINIVTRTAKDSGAEVFADGGSYGYFKGGAMVSHVRNGLSNQVSGSYSRSDGSSRSKAGNLNADFKYARLFYQGRYENDQVDVRWHAGFTNKDYGANTFYSTLSDEQFEHVRKYYTAVQAETKGDVYHFKPSVYWNRSDDRFEFYRGMPEKSPFNYHQTDVYGVNLNNYIQTFLGKTAFGAEFRNEGVRSTSLGEPLNSPIKVPGADADFTLGLNRTNLSFHLEHNIVLRRFTLSAGVIAVKNTGNEMKFRFYPGVDASYQFARDWKVYASYNTSLRMPTFTELYYSVGGHKADKYLKPEEMQAVEVGVKYLRPGIRGTLSLYRYHGTDMIDWIKDISQGDDAPWQSVNHAVINTMGAEASVLVDIRELMQRDAFVRSVNVSYSYIDQDKETTPNLQSKYALEYLRHKFVAQANFRIWKLLEMNVSYRWQDRMGNYQKGNSMVPYEPYSLVDARFTWNASQYKIYVEGNNLLNKTYYDHGNIPQPGIWIRAGASYRFKF